MRTAWVLLVSLLVVSAIAAPAAANGQTVSAVDRADLDCAFPYTITDATGQEIILEEPPERVVTTSPSAAQIMWEIGADDRVVGVTEHALYLEGADDRVIISDDDGFIDAELVVNAEPDLVLAPNATGSDTVDQLRDLGLTVYLFHEATDLDDVATKTGIIGEFVNACDGATETIDWMDEQLAIVDAAVADVERVSALYLFFDFTAGDGTFIDELITRAGADNAAAEAGIGGYQPISDEVVVNASPEWLILNSDDPGLPDSEAMNQTRAVQEDNIVVVQIEHLNQPAPRNIHAIVTLVSHFHPEAYEETLAMAEDADDHGNDVDDVADDAGDVTADDTDEIDAIADDDDQTGDDTADHTDDTADERATTMGDDQPDDALPGFGPISVLVGLIAGLLLLRRGG